MYLNFNAWAPPEVLSILLISSVPHYQQHTTKFTAPDGNLQEKTHAAVLKAKQYALAAIFGYTTWVTQLHID